MSLTQSVDGEVIVVLSDTTNTPVTGLEFDDVVCEYRKAGASSFVSKTLTIDDFTEIGSGVYTIDFTATELDTLGQFVIKVTGTGIAQSITIVDIVPAGTVSSAVTLSKCVISGQIADVTGYPIAGAAVTARVVGAPSIELNTVAVTDDLVSVKTDLNGEFFISLIRLADVEITIPTVNYKRRLVVPNMASATLFNIP